MLSASGIGITPAVGIMSSIVSLRHSLTRRSVTDPPGIVDIRLVWVVKRIQNSAWFKKKLQALHDVTSQPGSTVRLSISPYHTEAGSTQATRQQEESSSEEETEPMPTWWTISLGRPDLDSVFQGLKEQHAGCDVGVGLCGPNEMVKRARNAAVGANSTTGLSHIEDEVFERWSHIGWTWLARRITRLNATSQDEVTSSLVRPDKVAFDVNSTRQPLTGRALGRCHLKQVGACSIGRETRCNFSRGPASKDSPSWFCGGGGLGGCLRRRKLEALEESRNPVAAPKESQQRLTVPSTATATLHRPVRLMSSTRARTDG